MSTSTRVRAPALIGRRLAPPLARPGHAPPASDSRRTYALFEMPLAEVTLFCESVRPEVTLFVSLHPSSQ